jgi:hypothetical protein
MWLPYGGAGRHVHRGAIRGANWCQAARVEPVNHTGGPKKPLVSVHESEDEVSPKAGVAGSNPAGGTDTATEMCRSEACGCDAVGRVVVPTLCVATKLQVRPLPDCPARRRYEPPVTHQGGPDQNCDAGRRRVPAVGAGR